MAQIGRLEIEDIFSMNVGAAARRSGLPAKTIRYYEDIGLISPARAANGYRDYSADDIHRLAFLRRARGLGFSIEACRQLMALYRDKSRASHDVREIARSHVAAIEDKVRELQSMRATVSPLGRGDALSSRGRDESSVPPRRLRRRTGARRN
jgi:Cu(I)-responsive transcriptional regulator